MIQLEPVASTRIFDRAGLKLSFQDCSAHSSATGPFTVYPTLMIPLLPFGVGKFTSLLSSITSLATFSPAFDREAWTTLAPCPKKPRLEKTRGLISTAADQ